VIRCERDELVAVAAEDEETARQALALVDVQLEPMTPLLCPHQALHPDARQIHPRHNGNLVLDFDWSHGDLAVGEELSSTILEDEFELARVTHCCLGVSGIIAEFDAADDLILHSLTQVPFLYRRDLSKIVGVTPERIHVVQPTIGGGFGSKLDIYPYEPIAVFLARATRRPVRILFTREEEFIASPTRQPSVIRIRAGIDNKGALTFRNTRFLLDNGGATSWGATTPFVMMQTISSLYHVPHASFHAQAVATNNPYAGSFRGYGNLQATFAVETNLDRLATLAEIDPLKLRLDNAQQVGDISPQGMVFRSCGFRNCLERAAELSDWRHKRLEWGLSNPLGPKGVLRRGIGIASLLHVGGGAKIYRSDGCGTRLSIDHFGKVHLSTGATEIGQGSETVLAALVADELGLEIVDIRVTNDDTRFTPWDVGVHASRTSFIAGNSALKAARKVRRILLTAASERVGMPVESLTLRQRAVWNCNSEEEVMTIDSLVRELHFSGEHELLEVQVFYEPPSKYQDEKFHGDVSASYAWGVQVVEVEVDMQTGVVRPLQVTSVHDVGKVLNQLGIIGQVEGGVAMGLGYGLTEELLLQDGCVTNPSFRDYHLLSASEMPPVQIDFIESNDPEGPHGAKGIGEAPAIPTAAALVNAVAHATGVWVTQLPLKPEVVLQAMRGAGVDARTTTPPSIANLAPNTDFPLPVTSKPAPNDARLSQEEVSE
jgi:xanthine dehydrogenase molybdenum-binding subunit